MRKMEVEALRRQWSLCSHMKLRKSTNTAALYTATMETLGGLLAGVATAFRNSKRWQPHTNYISDDQLFRMQHDNCSSYALVATRMDKHTRYDSGSDLTSLLQIYCVFRIEPPNAARRMVKNQPRV